MSSWPAVKMPFKQEDFGQYCKSLQWLKWRPSLVVWHNTAAPSLSQWIDSAKKDASSGLIPGISRIKSLEKFFRDDNKWSGCPHLFIANDYIWIMNPLTLPGVHSPSWNGFSIGIEMIGDYSTEDDDTGEGLKVKNNCIYATAILCETLGLNPEVAIKLHKEDKKTTHDCPGEHIARDKSDMIVAVADLMAGGEHNPTAIGDIIRNGIPTISKDFPMRKFGETIVDDLNLRVGPSALSESKGSLPKGTRLEIFNEAKNATSVWLKVRSPAGYIGWVAGKFVTTEIKSQIT